MSKFPSIHVSDIPEFKRVLRKLGYKREPLCQSETLRVKHPDTGVTIIMWGKTSRANPFPRVSPNGAMVWEEHVKARGPVSL